MKKYIVLGILALSGCVTGVKPSNSEQAVYQIETSFKDALAVAVAYDSLPSCTGGTTAICSSTAIAKQIKDAKDKASLAIGPAEDAAKKVDAARAACNGDATCLASVPVVSQELIVGAQAAVTVLTALTTLESVQTAIKGAKKP